MKRINISQNMSRNNEFIKYYYFQLKQFERRFEQRSRFLETETL